MYACINVLTKLMYFQQIIYQLGGSINIMVTVVVMVVVMVMVWNLESLWQFQ